MESNERKQDGEPQELSLDDLKHVAGGTTSSALVKPLSTNSGGGLSDSGGEVTPGPLPGN